MISGIVAKILNRVLGSFIDDLKSNQLDISLFSGTVKLENLSLKKTVLDNLPVPFRLEHGSVGKIFVDIPIRNIGSSPVKIEVSNVFVLLKLKDKASWNEEAEIVAFQNSKKETLDNFEELQESARELRSKDPGYFGKLTSKIIDNLQVNVENVYIRVEDDLSYPGHPFACGLVLRRVMAVTTDNDWKIKYVEEAEQVHKTAGIRGLSIFFNYGDRNEQLFVEHLVGNKDLKSFVDFATAECTKGGENRAVLYPLNVELRAIINKNPKKNMAPQIWASLKIGGTFEPTPPEAGKGRPHLGLNVEIEQIPIVMKLLEYVGMYSKFQTGVLRGYQKDQFTEEEKVQYSPIYRDYIRAMRKNQPKVMNGKRDDLAKLELKFSVPAIRKIRVAERLEIDFEERKEEAKKKTEEMVKTLEGQKTSALTSVKSFFGSSSAKEEQKKVQEEIDKYRESLTKEQEEKLAQEREAIDKELGELFSTTAEIDVQTAIDMPPNYERFKFFVELNELSVAISRGFAFNRFDKMVELSITGINVLFETWTRYNNQNSWGRQ